MTADAVLIGSDAAAAARRVVSRTRGQAHGPITRLVSPGDLGQQIKPFVFLDYFDSDPKNGPGFGFHPHSGIATLTLILSGQASYKETTGREGVIETGGVEWGMTYLDVRLKAGDRWLFTPPKDYNVAWVALHEGLLSTPPRIETGEAVVFEEGREAIEFQAVTDAGFVLGSAIKHPYDLVTGHYSVHTNVEALQGGAEYREHRPAVAQPGCAGLRHAADGS